jgi:hypothetical protein
MKKVAFVLMLLVPVLFSCGKKGEKSNDHTNNDTTKAVVVIDSLAFEADTFHVIEKEKKCPNDNCSSVDLYYEKIRIPMKSVHDSINMYIDTLVWGVLAELGGEEFKYDMKKRAEAFFTSKREIEADNNESGAPWDFELRLNIFRPCNEIFTVSSSWGGYTGGAHGNYTTQTTSFFTNTGKVVTMNDLFNNMEAVNKMGLKYFKQDNQLDVNVDCSEQGWDFTDEDFQLNENFDIGTEAITWQFNSYEIGPYVAGAPSVTIPMKELAGYMRVKFTDIAIK